LALSPNSLATTAADLPLVSQLLTASRLNVSSNLRRVVTGDCFKVLIIQAFTQSSVHQFAPTSECPQTAAGGSWQSKLSAAQVYDIVLQISPKIHELNVMLQPPNKSVTSIITSSNASTSPQFFHAAWQTVRATTR
jgi:hypothetical protein